MTKGIVTVTFGFLALAMLSLAIKDHSIMEGIVGAISAIAGLAVFKSPDEQ